MALPGRWVAGSAGSAAAPVASLPPAAGPPFSLPGYAAVRPPCAAARDDVPLPALPRAFAPFRASARPCAAPAFLPKQWSTIGVGQIFPWKGALRRASVVVCGFVCRVHGHDNDTVRAYKSPFLYRVGEFELHSLRLTLPGRHTLTYNNK